MGFVAGRLCVGAPVQGPGWMPQGLDGLLGAAGRLVGLRGPAGGRGMRLGRRMRRAALLLEKGGDAGRVLGRCCCGWFWSGWWQKGGEGGREGVCPPPCAVSPSLPQSSALDDGTVRLCVVLINN